MSKLEKLRKRIQTRPKDFAWDELLQLMESFDFQVHLGSGSSRKFIHKQTQAALMLHQPHPGSILKSYQVRAVLAFLTNEGYMK